MITKKAKASDLTHFAQMFSVPYYLEGIYENLESNLNSLSKEQLKKIISKLFIEQDFEAVLKEEVDLHLQEELLLRSAVYQQNLKLARFLLQHGSDPNVRNSAMLNDAISSNNKDLIALLLEYGINANAQDGYLLMRAIYNENVEIVELMNKNNIAKEEHFVQACHFSSIEVVEYFINKGYNIKTAQTSSNETIAKWANSKEFSDNLSKNLKSKRHIAKTKV